MARKEFSRKVRQAAIARANGHCEKCKAVLKTGEAEVDHILPDVLGGEPTLANAQVLCRVCHKAKTHTDIKQTRKADRQRDRHTGAIQPKGTIQSRGFAKKERAPKLPVPGPRPIYEAQQ